ncbi:hypothetical protein LCGC14_1080330 [marine sediment metagenome]|uniref:Uncharacterized protein n=1 Tax=marine sediment metagenome TaxID=412755 RepID=A0A0F9MFJ6_9ZZZZ
MNAKDIVDASSSTDPGAEAPRVAVRGFFYADGGEATTLHLDTPVTELRRAGWEEAYRDMYQGQAERFVAELLDAAPGGLVDAIFAELARRKASVLRVPLGAGHGR